MLLHPTQALPTVRIRQAESDEPLVINACDYVAAVHELYDPPAPAPEPELPPTVVLDRTAYAALEAQGAALEVKVAHLADVYAALRVDAGGDPFAAIAMLQARAARAADLEADAARLQVVNAALCIDSTADPVAVIAALRDAAARAAAPAAAEKASEKPKAEKPAKGAK